MHTFYNWIFLPQGQTLWVLALQLSKILLLYHQIPTTYNRNIELVVRQHRKICHMLRCIKIVQVIFWIAESNSMHQTESIDVKISNICNILSKPILYTNSALCVADRQSEVIVHVLENVYERTSLLQMRWWTGNCRREELVHEIILCTPSRESSLSIIIQSYLFKLTLWCWLLYLECGISDETYGVKDL